MFNLYAKNLNDQPVRVVAGPRSELADSVIHFIKDGTDPEGLTMATIDPNDSYDLAVADVDVAVFYLPPLRGAPAGDGTFALDIQNTSANPVRVQYGDVTTEAMEETTIEPGDEVTIEGTDTWRIAVSLLGVEGEHMPPIDPDAFTRGG